MPMARRIVAALSLLALLAPGAARADDSVLGTLVKAPGVSGFERDVRDAIARMLPAWAKPRVDEAGNLVVTIGQGQPHLLIAASIDEDGYLVSDITGEGYLRLTRVSTGASFRLFDQFIYGQPILIRTANADGAPAAAGGGPAGRSVPGVCVTASSHLQRGRDASTAIKGLDDLWVDVGAEHPGRGRIARDSTARHRRLARPRSDPGRGADGRGGCPGERPRGGARQAPRRSRRDAGPARSPAR